MQSNNQPVIVRSPSTKLWLRAEMDVVATMPPSNVTATEVQQPVAGAAELETSWSKENLASKSLFATSVHLPLIAPNTEHVLPTEHTYMSESII